MHVDLGGGTLTGGDGVLLDGQTLYVVRGGEGVLVPVELSEDFTSGGVGEGYSDPSFARPTKLQSLLTVSSSSTPSSTGASRARVRSCRLPSPPSRYLRRGQGTQSAYCHPAYIG